MKPHIKRIHPVFLILLIALLTSNCAKDSDLYFELAKYEETVPEEENAEEAINQQETEEESPEEISENNLLKGTFWVDNQMDEVKNRLLNGWNNKNFPDEVSIITQATEEFINNPSSTRYSNYDLSYPFGAMSYEYNQSVALDFEPQPRNNEKIDYPFKAAIYGRAFQDKDLANLLLGELLWHAKNEHLKFSDNLKFPKDRMADVNPYFLIMSWVGKWHEIYREYIEEYSNVSSEEKQIIENWFSGAADWAYHTCNNRIKTYLGNNWVYEDKGRRISMENLSSPTIQDQNGVPYLEYTISDFSEGLNNRLWDGIEFIHSYGLSTGNVFYRDIGVSYFKYAIKYHVYPNGLLGEIKRVTSNDPSIAIAYSYVILTAMTRIAHAEKVAAISGLINNYGWSEENLYDYESSIGHIQGNVYDGYMYRGGSTTNGNPKSLKLALKALSRFYRSPENGGFNPEFYFNGTKISGENRKYPAVFGMANSYYNDNFLWDHASMNASAGLPTGKINDQISFGKGVMSWGKGLSPILWLDMEGKIF